MKNIIKSAVAVGLFILTLAACTETDDMNHINLSVNELHAPKTGLDETITGNNSFTFYLIKEQGDTIYWVNDSSYQEKSEQKGYHFYFDRSAGHRIITGNNMTIEKYKALDFTIKLESNPYNEQRVITFVVMPIYRELGRMDSLKITQDY